jgi:hypothetical protein
MTRHSNWLYPTSSAFSGKVADKNEGKDCTENGNSVGA